MKDFDYLGANEIYLDGACQSLRPRPVIQALNNYYENFNSCGERVKYPWGITTDKLVNETRKKVIKFLKLKSKDYFTSFTLNTTYGINLILGQLDASKFKKIYTSEIEHNSPFLATMSFAKKNNIPREILKREDDGKVDLDVDFSKAIVVVNCVSNFDGRKLLNINELIKKVHKAGGIVIIDAAQAVAHNADILYKTEPDAVCFSAHKMYAPSLGVMVVRTDLLKYIETSFIGGGMVDDVTADSYLLSAENSEHIYTKFESGLQAWGEIVALGEAIDWLEARTKEDKKQLLENEKELFDFLNSRKKVHLVNKEPSSVITFYVEGVDSHLLGAALGDEGIMARTGYFCAHYYLDKVKHLPPLVRFSLGYQTRPEDIKKVVQMLDKITK